MSRSKHTQSRNLTAVDGGSTATYTYDSLNNRVARSNSSGNFQLVYDIQGRRVSEYNAGSSNAFVEADIYSDTNPVAFRTNGQTYYEHQNWLGTERLRTTYNGAVDSTFQSLPFGDGYTFTGSQKDQYDFAGLDRDSEDSTEHAQFRNYATLMGRWLSPDPYYGSYDFSNPQTLNRYAYVLNNPLGFVDPAGRTSATLRGEARLRFQTIQE